MGLEEELTGRAARQAGSVRLGTRIAWLANFRRTRDSPKRRVFRLAVVCRSDKETGMRTLLIVLAFVLSFAAVGEAVEPSAIKEGAETTAKAMERGDYGTVLDRSYPKVIKMGGGRAEMLRQVEEAMGAMKKDGITITSVTVGNPGEPVRGQGQLFSIVPIVLKMDAPKAVVTSNGYLLAVSEDKGATWAYVDGSSLTPEFARKLFPKFPPSLKLPEKKEPVVEKK
jgi:hypothetical protein